MVYWGLDKHFDYIVTSEEAGFDKPNPVPFEIAKRKINPKGDNIWMIGDNYIADICGARDSINATTLQKTHDSDACDETNGIKPDLIFNSFKDIRNLLRGISNE
jgi:putative hydrolase of the HAD superfamily